MVKPAVTRQVKGFANQLREGLAISLADHMRLLGNTRLMDYPAASESETGPDAGDGQAMMRTVGNPTAASADRRLKTLARGRESAVQSSVADLAPTTFRRYSAMIQYRVGQVKPGKTKLYHLLHRQKPGYAACGVKIRSITTITNTRLICSNCIRVYRTPRKSF